MSLLADDGKAMARLRQIRNAYIADMDSESIRFLSAGKPLPDDLLTYLQELRDMPQNIIPTLNENGELDETKFTWAVPPIWWWTKKGFDAR
jgi:hypothetical protein